MDKGSVAICSVTNASNALRDLSTERICWISSLTGTHGPSLRRKLPVI
jgi:hypothetical protein